MIPKLNVSLCLLLTRLTWRVRLEILFPVYDDAIKQEISLHGAMPDPNSQPPSMSPLSGAQSEHTRNVDQRLGRSNAAIHVDVPGRQRMGRNSGGNVPRDFSSLDINSDGVIDRNEWNSRK